MMFAIKNTFELARTFLCKTTQCRGRLSYQTYGNISFPLSEGPLIRRNAVSRYAQARHLCLLSNKIWNCGYPNSMNSYTAVKYRICRFLMSDASIKENSSPDAEPPKTVGTQYADAVDRNSLQDQSDGLQAVSDQMVEEELLRYDYENVEYMPDEPATLPRISKKPLPISLERGKTGVFDVEEIVALLEDENARDVCVLPVPPEYHYVDYLVVATGKSTRHLRAMAEFIKWMYKRKHSTNDPPSVRIEGEQCKDWFAIDLGNIAVHLFLHDTRRHYDLETLWTEGYAAETDPVADQETLQRQDFSFDAELERLRKMKEARRIAMGAKQMPSVSDSAEDIADS